uniref:Uncharacterized protein n=1 Tax=Caenorhabditis japonica TaxID=281687 RepID=A0A8R1EKB4_CAEJA
MENDDYVWSAGGDKKILNWSIQHSQVPRRSVDLGLYDKPIRKISLNTDVNKMVVLLEKFNSLVLIDLNHEPIQPFTLSYNQEHFLDVATSGEYFCVLGNSATVVIDGFTLNSTTIPFDLELAASVSSTKDAIDNFYKNVTHNNRAEYEKRKAEKFDAISEKKRRINSHV